MMMTQRDPLVQTLLRLRRRLAGQTFVQIVSRALLVAAVLLALLAGINADLTIVVALPFAALMLGALALLFSLAWTFHRSPTVPEMASLIDRLGATHDRFATALELSSDPAPGMRALAREECIRFLSQRDFRSLLPWKFPRAVLWLAAPLALIAALHFQTAQRVAERLSERQAGEALLQPQLEGLHALADSADARSKTTDSKDLAEAAKQIRQAAERLLAEAASPDAAQKAALRELSALEQQLRALQSDREPLSEAELAALKKALEQSEATRPAAAELAKGSLEAAAQALDEAARALAEKKEADAGADAKKNVVDAAQRTALQKQLSQAMKQLAEQAGKPGSSASELMRKIAEALRKQAAQQQQQAGRGGGKSSEQSLKQLLATLQNMKAGQTSQPGRKNAPGKEGKAAGENGKPDAPDGKKQGDTLVLIPTTSPSGRPGSDEPSPPGGDPIGQKLDPASAQGGEIRLQGELGEGESLSQFLPSADGSAPLSRRYKELYEAMAPAAEDAVNRDEIPLGSRFSVKRYFEAIRPPE